MDNDQFGVGTQEDGSGVEAEFFKDARPVGVDEDVGGGGESEEEGF